MRVLILGGAGFLGCNLVRGFLKTPDTQLTVIDSLDPRFLSTQQSLSDVWDQIEFIQGDLCNEELLSDQVRGQDVICNCAAQTSHPLSIREPLLDVDINCVGNLKLLEAVRRFNSDAIVVYPSSSTVIGKALRDIVDEDHGQRPLEIYSANKGVAEKYFQIYHTIHQLKTVVLRFANLYGPYGKDSPNFGFINYFIAQASQQKTLQLFGDGSQMRDVMHVDDAVVAIMLAIKKLKSMGKLYFVTSDEHLSVRQIAESIVAEYPSSRLETSPWPEHRKAIEIEDVRFSSDRFRSQTGWRPTVSFVEGLKRTRSVMEGKAT
jgi:UDP-glucose 4-epimerase